LDVSRLLQQIVPHQVEGRPAIAGSGFVKDFLYHPETAFMAVTPLEIRNQRNPNISFMQINQIQREEMVQGRRVREPTSQVGTEIWLNP
jgi:hypothetical protein